MENTSKAVVLGLGLNGLGVVRSLTAHRIPVIAVGSDFSNAADFTRLCKKVRCPDLYDDGIVDFLIGLSKKEASKPVLFLTVDENVAVVSRYRDDLQEYFHFSLPEKETVDLLLNKRQFAHFANKEGFCIPRTYFASSIEEIIKISHCVTYPCIFKPSFRGTAWELSGVRKVFKVNNPWDLVRCYKDIEFLQRDVIVQEWMVGTDAEVYFCLLYFDRSASCVAHFVGRKIRQSPPECGSTSLAISCDQDHVLDEAIRLFEKVSFRGIGSVEFKFDLRDKKFKITEPTVGRTNLQSAIATACGVNLPYIAYMDILRKEYPKPTKQPNGIKWINERSDMLSAYYYISNKKLGFWQWLNSLRGRKSFAVFSLADPGPFFVLCWQVAWQALFAFLRNMRELFSMKNFKTMFKKNVTAFNAIRYFSAVYIAPVVRRNHLKILAYHRVLDAIHGQRFDFDESVISASLSDFEEQIKWLKDNFNVITFNVLKGGRLPPNPLIITFDDGYRDNYVNAYPILRKYKVPATIFLSTGYIGTAKLFWWDEIAYLIKNTFRNRLVLDTEIKCDCTLITDIDRKTAIKSILKLAKNLSMEKISRVVEDIKHQLKIGLDGDCVDVKDIAMNWDEVREMSAGGMEFGSHTVNHPILIKETAHVIDYEIRKSKETIESYIGKEVIAAAYPIGGANRFDDRAVKSLSDCGYLYAATLIPGNNKINRLDSLKLKRVAIEKEDTLHIFKSKVMLS